MDSRNFFLFSQLLRDLSFLMLSKIQRVSPFLWIPIYFKSPSLIFNRALPVILLFLKSYIYWFIFMDFKNSTISWVSQSLILLVATVSWKPLSCYLKSSKEIVSNWTDFFVEEKMDYLEWLLVILPSWESLFTFFFGCIMCVNSYISFCCFSEN